MDPPPLPPIYNTSVLLLSNTGPPEFDQEFASIITLNSGEKVNVLLPTISDPDNDAYTIRTELGEAKMFTEFINHKMLAFNPIKVGKF